MSEGNKPVEASEKAPAVKTNTMEVVRALNKLLNDKISGFMELAPTISDPAHKDLEHLRNDLTKLKTFAETVTAENEPELLDRIKKMNDRVVTTLKCIFCQLIRQAKLHNKLQDDITAILNKLVCVVNYIQGVEESKKEAIRRSLTDRIRDTDMLKKESTHLLTIVEELLKKFESSKVVKLTREGIVQKISDLIAWLDDVKGYFIVFATIEQRPIPPL